MALARRLSATTGSKVQRAYQRFDFLEQRRALTRRRAEHVIGQDGQVLKLATG